MKEEAIWAGQNLEFRREVNNLGLTKETVVN